MTELLTAAQMRAIEQAAIESGEVTGLELMERAGRGVVEAIFEEWPEVAKTSHRAVVLCGPGNNGGDGFVVARLLKEWGWEVEVFLYGDAEKLPPDARFNYERWGELGRTVPLSKEKLPKGEGVHLVVDALFGIGLTRPLSEELVEDWDRLFSFAFEAAHKLAVDIPSGLCSESGRILAPGDAKLDEEWLDRAFTADLTVTFQATKPGHLLADGPDCTGKISVVDLGIGDRNSVKRAFVKLYDLPSEAPRHGRFLIGLESAECVAEYIFKDGDHKYTHGHALILSGGPGKTGAARLAARGALRIGAGLVTLGCHESALPEVASQVTAIMTRPIDDADALADVLEDDRLNALCLGPGLGLNDQARSLLEMALTCRAEARPTGTNVGRASARHPRQIVLDADALTLVASDENLFDALHQNCVLTPHTGEFRRLFPDIADKLDAPAATGPAYSKVDATRDAAKRAGCTILFKGPDTVIADQTGRCSINASVYDRAAPWLATAGSGDVLAGFITGLLARGFTPMHAAETAVWLHTECALSFGPGLIAEDLPEELPKVLRALSLPE